MEEGVGRLADWDDLVIGRAQCERPRPPLGQPHGGAAVRGEGPDNHVRQMRALGLAKLAFARRLGQDLSK